MSDLFLERLTEMLSPVAGLTALVLGGSRARGTATSQSDYDLGLYYDPNTPLDIDGLKAALASLSDASGIDTITRLGEWGPWINGGGWLSIEGRKVDLLYRDLARVRSVITEGKAGQISMAYQPGHPHGFCSAIWIGEIALCRPLHDPNQAIAALKAEVAPFPEPLRTTLIGRFQWEMSFSIDNLESARHRRDQTHSAGCTYRALCCLAQVLFALNGRYLINEKGALAEAAGFALTVPDLDQRTTAIWAAIGGGDFDAAIGLLRTLTRALDDIVLDPRPVR